MPWCEACEKNWTPTSLPPDGTCPSCGAPVNATPGVDHAPVPHRTPWHFWVGIAAVTIYLTWRLVQGIMLLF